MCYSSYVSEALIITSAKEVSLEIQLNVGLEIEGVTVSAFTTISEPLNELAVVSTRSFTAEEADRYNRPEWAMNISVDISNIIGHDNPSGAGYNAATNELYFHYHSGLDLIPLLSIQVDF